MGTERTGWGLSGISVTLLYSFLLLTIVPLGVLGIKYNFATGAQRGVTLSAFTYGFVVLILIAVFAVGAVVVVAQMNHSTKWWTAIGITASVIPVFAMIVGSVAFGVGGDIPRLLVIGLFWFVTAVYVLSLGYVVDRRLDRSHDVSN